MQTMIVRGKCLTKNLHSFSVRSPAGSCLDGRSTPLDIGRKAADRCRELRRATIGVGDGASHGLSASQLFTWRRLAREDRLSGDAVPALVPVEIAVTQAPGSRCAPQPPSSPPAQRERVGIIEIELSGGCRVRVDRDVDAEALQRVLELLRRR
jgi:transposase-like protein